MSSPLPVVYIFFGDDDFSIQQAVADLVARLGDPAAMMMDSIQLDGRACSIDEVRGAAYAIPFLSPRRLVVVENLVPRLTSDQQREQFKGLLEGVPGTSALVLVENRQSKDIHWLLRWASKNEKRAFSKEFSHKKPDQMTRWILDVAKVNGGSFSYAGAQALVSIVGSDTRLAQQEIDKLLAYNNYIRPVEPEDVELLCAPVAEGGIFDLVDSLGIKNGPRAVRILSQLLADQEALGIFGMVVRQYRLLLQAREILDQGGNEAVVAKEVRPDNKTLHPYVVKKIVQQARNFTQEDLDHIYHLLLEVDASIKTGESEAEIALNTFIASLSAR